MKIKYSNGLVPTIIQDSETKDVLSLFYGNRESINKMLATSEVWRYSRSKGKVVKKGEESGNTQRVKEILTDCDRDTLLVKVIPKGPGCHLGYYSCFSFTLDGKLKEQKPSARPLLDGIFEVIKNRKSKPTEESYVSSIIFDERKIVGKLREECEELINAKMKSEVVWEAADILFFIMVFLASKGIELNEVFEELAKRRGKRKK